MNPEVKKIFVLFNELIQNQSDNILLPPCLKLPNSNSRVFLRNKLTNRRPSKYQYILTFEDLLKLKTTNVLDIFLIIIQNIIFLSKKSFF